MSTLRCAVAAALAATAVAGAQSSPVLRPSDLHALQAVGDVQLSPIGDDVAFTVASNEGPGRPRSTTWVRGGLLGAPVQLKGSGLRWSRDGRHVAYFGETEEGAGLVVARPSGEQARLIAPVRSTNHPLPSSGQSLTWSADGRFIAFLSATEGPEGAPGDGDPMVITRYLFKPTASEGLTRFNDNRRLHIFVADVAARTVRQLTDGPYYEHSIDWSPTGDDIVFVSNREANPDKVFNYDLFTVHARTGAIRRLTTTKSAEYYPSFSPDGLRIAFTGTTRDLTSSETTMEDTHVWVVRADGSERVEVGRGIDNRQGAPKWSRDGGYLLFTVQDRGSVKLMAVRSGGASPPTPITLVGERGSVGAFSVAEDVVAYVFTSPSAPAELYRAKLGRAREDGNDAAAAVAKTLSLYAPTALTRLNRAALNDKRIAEVESFTFSHEGLSVEAFLTVPHHARTAPPKSVPLIVQIHGGPHGQQGPGFNPKAQVYAGLGWASLMVNYRGSTGYGQAFADAIFRDQNGAEARDVLAGVDAALATYPWLDGARLGIEGGSYGGQLTNWIVTQSTRFRAAVPSAGISNLVTQNYLAYYHDYLAVEYGAFPHERVRTDPSERLVIDMLWERSPIRYANRVKTPVLFVHGEHDNDVPIEEAEQFFIALHDVGVETVMLRYPREGHGLRETKHVVDALERSIAWYRKHGL